MNKKFNIFMIGWEYPPHNSGGLGVACQGLTEALAARNHNLYFTLPYDLKSLPAHMQVISCRDPNWDAKTNDRPPFAGYLSQVVDPVVLPGRRLAAHDLATLPTSEIEHKVREYADLVLEKARRAGDFDGIHAHDWMSFPAALKVKEETGKPLVTHIHSTELDRIPEGAGSPYITEIEQKGMEASDVVIAVSNYTKRLLVKEYSIPARKILVVHNGMNFSSLMDPGKHHFAQKRPVIVFMGRLTGQKGPAYFVSLAREVLAKLPEALFIVAGSGDMYHQLLLKTAGESLSAKVLFSGFVRDSQRETLLDRADVFVMPSLSEPFGLVALEAAERNTPVIISKHTGVGEVMPSALAIDFWDIDKMSQAVVRLASDHAYHGSVVIGQQQELSQLTWNTAARKLERIYKKAFFG